MTVATNRIHWNQVASAGTVARCDDMVENVIAGVFLSITAKRPLLSHVCFSRLWAVCGLNKGSRFAADNGSFGILTNTWTSTA
jgi:hypothetical protein